MPTSPQFQATAAALTAVTTLLNANPPPPAGPERDALMSAATNLSVALARIALQDFESASALVQAAAQSLADVMNAASAPAKAAVQHAAAALPPVPVAPAPGGGPPPPAPGGPPPAGSFASRLASAATGEWNFFGGQTYDAQGHLTRSGHKEGENGWFQKVGEYWLRGTNTTGVNGLTTGMPWSAAFVSWCEKQALAGDRFRYSTQHSVYIFQSIRDHLQNNGNAGYWGWRLNEHRPAVGDLVCWSRQSGIDFDHQAGGDYKGHSDIVVEVTQNEAIVIGGNVGNSVTRRPVTCGPDGFLRPQTVNGELLFGIMECRIA